MGVSFLERGGLFFHLTRNETRQPGRLSLRPLLVGHPFPSAEEVSCAWGKPASENLLVLERPFREDPLVPRGVAHDAGVVGAGRKDRQIRLSDQFHHRAAGDLAS